MEITIFCMVQGLGSGGLSKQLKKKGLELLFSCVVYRGYEPIY